MPDHACALSHFSNTRKWPAQPPDRLQLYSLPTPQRSEGVHRPGRDVPAMFGQLGFFHKFAGKDYEDKRPRDRYLNESRRLLGVLNQRMAARQWILGDTHTIADIAI